MFADLKFGSALVGLVCITLGCMMDSASAVTAEVANGKRRNVINQMSQSHP
jgi:hypothetical protein